MSITYSIFGATYGDATIEGLRGPSGYGFNADPLTNDYDFQNHNVINAENIELTSLSPLAPATDVTIQSGIILNGNLDMNNNNILQNLDIATNTISTNTAGNITMNNNVSMNNNNITDANLTYTQGLIVDTLIAQDSTQINLNNTIYGNSNNLTSIGNIESTGYLYLGSSLTNPPTNNVRMLLQDIDDSMLYLESDINNLGTRQPYFKMSSRNDTSMRGYSNNFTNNNQNVEFLVGNNTSTSGFQFTCGYTPATKNIGDPVTFVGPYTHPLYIYPTVMNSAVPLDMGVNNINNINNLDVQGQISNSAGDLQINDTTNFNYNIIDNVQEIAVDTITSVLPATTINVSRNIDMSTKDIYVNNIYLKGAFYNSGIPTNIQVGNSLDLQTNSILNIGLLDFATQPTLDNTTTRLLTVDATTGNVKYRASTTILNNPFNQSLNTTDSPTFNNLTVSAIGNSSTNITLSPTSTLTVASGKNIQMNDGVFALNAPLGTYTTSSPPSVGVNEMSIFNYNNKLYANNSSSVYGLSDPFYDRNTVTQITSIATSVTANVHASVITTVSASTGGQNFEQFTVNNNLVTATSIIQTSVVGYSGTYGTNGIPISSIDNITAGTFDIILINTGANALSGTVNIQFTVYR